MRQDIETLLRIHQATEQLIRNQYGSRDERSAWALHQASQNLLAERGISVARCGHA
jgi:hypothetical protein